MTYGTLNVDSVVSSDGTTAGGLYGFKNRIINGAMVIDQRNAGASLTIGANGQGYPVDRFRCDSAYTQSITAQQVSANLSNFQNALQYTAGTASTNSNDVSEIVYFIEGYNVADLQFGTANAQTFTLSFWAKSSLTGTFGLVLENSAQNRQYLTTYSIPVANTWTYITKTIVGDTSGTWQYTTSRGLGIRWDMGVNAANSAAATGAWGTSSAYGITGAVKLTQTTGATFTITGVQIEKGSTATSFDYRPYGTELALCQRYFYKYASGATVGFGVGWNYSATLASCMVYFPVTMRVAPSLLAASGTNYYAFLRNGTTDYVNSFTQGFASPQTSEIYNSTEASGTAGQAGVWVTDNASASIAFNSEL